MKNVLWFSRHNMSAEQLIALGPDVNIHQLDRTINSVYEIIDEIKWADIIAIVAPINLQQQFLEVAGDKPVIFAKNGQRRGDDEFEFLGWERLVKIDVITEEFKISEVG